MGDDETLEEVSYRPTVTWATAVLGVLGSLLSVALLFTADTNDDPRPSPPPNPAFVSTEDLEREIDSVRRELIAVERSVHKIGRPLPRGIVAARMRSTETSVRSLSGRLGRLEKALTETPADALRLPLLQTQLDAVEQRTDSEIRAIADGVNRQYDLMKWVIGTLAVGLLAIAASVIVAVVKK